MTNIYHQYGSSDHISNDGNDNMPQCQCQQGLPGKRGPPGHGIKGDKVHNIKPQLLGHGLVSDTRRFGVF